MSVYNTSSSGRGQLNGSQILDFKLSRWIYWIVAHFVAFPLAVAIGFIAIHIFSFVENILPQIVASGLGYVLWGATIGGIIGLIQWLLLRNRIPLKLSWIWYNMLGIGLAELLGVAILLIFNIDRNIDLMYSFGMEVWSLIYLVGGVFTGIFQSLTLKGITKNYKIWIWGSSISWGISTLIWTGVIRFLTNNPIMVLLGGLLLGIISALFINSIFRNK